MAAPGAGVPPVPGGNAGQIAAALAAQHAARKGRLKQSFTFLTCSHISDSSTLELLGDPLSPMFHNGPDAYDWIMQQVIKPPSTVDLQDMTIEFWLIEIITGVGISDNSIADSIQMLVAAGRDRRVPTRETLQRARRRRRRAGHAGRPPISAGCARRGRPAAS